MSNEDSELNHRGRTKVGPLVFSPEIRSVYRPRSSIQALARQFASYGAGKAEVARRHPDSIRWRHLVPPAFCLCVLLAPVGMISRSGRIAVAGLGASYARSEEHTSELQSLMRISYAVFCLKKKNST